MLETIAADLGVTQQGQLHDEILAHAYNVEREVGRGATGVVYKIVTHRSRRVCALKKLSVKHLTSAQRVRKLAEAQHLQGIVHPSIIRCLDVFIDEDILHIAMEFAEYGDLAQASRAQSAVGYRPTAREDVLLGRVLHLEHPLATRPRTYALPCSRHRPSRPQAQQYPPHTTHLWSQSRPTDPPVAGRFGRHQRSRTAVTLHNFQGRRHPSVSRTRARAWRALRQQGTPQSHRRLTFGHWAASFTSC